MHDIKGLEELGVPCVAVVSTEFAVAAESQNKALGFDPAIVFVPHPIQDRTRDELRELADIALEPLLAALTAEP
jgi:hypothetical protein